MRNRPASRVCCLPQGVFDPNALNRLARIQILAVDDRAAARGRRERQTRHQRIRTTYRGERQQAESPKDPKSRCTEQNGSKPVDHCCDGDRRRRRQSRRQEHDKERVGGPGAAHHTSQQNQNQNDSGGDEGRETKGAAKFAEEKSRAAQAHADGRLINQARVQVLRGVGARERPAAGQRARSCGGAREEVASGPPPGPALRLSRPRALTIPARSRRTARRARRLRPRASPGSSSGRSRGAAPPVCAPADRSARRD